MSHQRCFTVARGHVAGVDNCVESTLEELLCKGYMWPWETETKWKTIDGLWMMQVLTAVEMTQPVLFPLPRSARCDGDGRDAANCRCASPYLSLPVDCVHGCAQCGNQRRPMFDAMRSDHLTKGLVAVEQIRTSWRWDMWVGLGKNTHQSETMRSMMRRPAAVSKLVSVSTGSWQRRQHSMRRAKAL